MKRTLLRSGLPALALGQTFIIDPNTGEAIQSSSGISLFGTTIVKNEVALIPKGATENNEEGFYLDGWYATVQDQYGELYLEVELELHHNHIPQVNNGVYMVWIQVIDPVKSKENSMPYYEGFSCAIRYDESLGTKIRSNYLTRTGYIGTRSLAYDRETYKRLLREDQTELYPWLL